MAYEHLSSFIAALEDDGDLVRIAVEVDPKFELAAIVDRISKCPGGGPALFFENVKGHSIPMAANVLGSRRRMLKALGADSFDDVADRIAKLIAPDLPAGWTDSLRLVPHLAELTKLPPKTLKTGICQQVVKMGHDVDLGELPVPHSWPEEKRATIRMGQIFTLNPHSGVRNVSMSPLEIRDGGSLLIHWNPHQDGFQNHAEWQRLGRQMPVAVVLGGDPIYACMANAPLPPNTDECLFGGFLRGRSIELVHCRSIDLDVPADAEIVIEGLIDPSVPSEPAGPIGAPTGFSSQVTDAPVINVTALTHRANPIFPATVVGEPPTEMFWIEKATERMFLPLVRLFIPELVDLHLPRAGAFRNLAFVSIRKQYPQQAQKVMNALWSLRRLMVMKMIVVVDDDVDVHNEEQVWFTVGAHVHPGRDVTFSQGPTDWNDHAAPVQGMGNKMGIDATRKQSDEGHPRPWPAPLQVNEEIETLITRRWAEYGFEAT